MTKTTITAALLAALTTGAASAQQRTIYNAGGNVVGRSATDSSGAVKNYDARGRVISRESTIGTTTTMRAVATSAGSRRAEGTGRNRPLGDSKQEKS